MSKSKESAASVIDASKLKRKGVLTPEECAAWMILAGFPKNAQVLAEGLATIFAESGFNSEANNGVGYVGLWQEEEGFGGISNPDREDAKISTEKAFERWKSDGESFVDAWGMSDNEAHANFGSYKAAAENVIKSGVTGTPKESANTTTEAAGEVGGAVSIQEVEASAKAASFSAYLELPGLLNSAESEALRGQRSLMNDTPLLPFIEQLTKSSLRRFQSLPNGNFYAFYPDYFGGLNKTPYWEIHDIEILDGKINLSDEALATHVYVVGDNAGWYDGVTEVDKIASAGVVTIFHAMMAHFITGYSETAQKPTKTQREEEASKTKAQALNFLKKYGARPYYEEAPMVRSPYFEMFLAYQQFCLLWAKQFETEFELTYMPELFPGGLVSLPEHGLQLFIEEVNHEFDYENGFRTTVSFTAPASLENGPLGLSDGMIRADALEPPT